MIYFDPKKKQLIYTGASASDIFWDGHWRENANIRDEIKKNNKTLTSKITKKYLKPGDGIILEGGCGNGTNVASLVNNGYKCTGIDYAKETVSMLNQYIPELDIRLGDVKRIPFNDNYFIGYWSLGLIEHYYEGYEAIALEMSRVIRSGGYLFLTFPYMSFLRRLKAKFGLYELWQKKTDEGFYQFILNPEIVKSDFKRFKFKLIKTIPFDGIKGLKAEVPILKPFLQSLYYYKGANVFIKFVRKVIESAASPVAGHDLLLVFKKS